MQAKFLPMKNLTKFSKKFLQGEEPKILLPKYGKKKKATVW